MLFLTPPPARATNPVCHVVLSIDRSLSVGTDGLDVMRTQLGNLFDATFGTDVDLSFWTFSHEASPSPPFNYNAFYSSRWERVGNVSDKIDFDQAFSRISPDGQTNYEQALSYSKVDLNNPSSADIPNQTNSTITQFRNEADVIAVVTDGEPNYPGNQDPNPNSASTTPAEDSAKSAVSLLRTAKPDIQFVGGIIGGASQKSLNYMINGDKNRDTDSDGLVNVGPIQGFDDSIETFLTNKVNQACNKLHHTTYSLEPAVNVDGTAVQAGDTINFTYSVNNSTPDSVTGNSNWKLYDVVINPDVTTDPLNFNGGQSGCTTTSSKTYCDGVADCTAVKNMFGSQRSSVSCDEVPQSGRGMCGTTQSTNPGNSGGTPFAFIPGLNSSNFYSPPRCQTIDNLALGTRVCSILAVTDAGGGVSNRISNAACVTIGKSPLVQVQGGDVRVGRQLNMQSLGDLSAGVYTSQFKLSGTAGTRTYGSWVEYGVLAPGPVKRFASLSGYAGAYGGYDSPITPNTCDLNINKLTFANKVANAAHSTECGYLTETPGLVPDVVTSLTSGAPVTPVPQPLDPGAANGLYENSNPNATFTISGGTVPKGKTVIVYVPKGTVTISGDIQYTDDASSKYTNITDIPQLVVIAKDINISEGVKRVDGWLVAAGDGASGGTIDTCYGFAHPLSSNVCNQPLAINGPVIARQLNLWRTKVDLSACKINNTSDCTTSGDPAEIINLPASSVLWARAYGLNNARAETTYTTELPPFF